MKEGKIDKRERKEMRKLERGRREERRGEMNV